MIVLLALLGAVLYVVIGGYVGGLCQAQARKMCNSCKSIEAKEAAYQEARANYTKRRNEAMATGKTNWPSVPYRSDYVRDCPNSHNASGWGLIWPVVVVFVVVFVVVGIPLFYVALALGKAAAPAGHGLRKLWTSPHALGNSYYVRRDKRHLTKEAVR